MDRRRNCIRSGSTRDSLQDEQERKESSSEICSDIKVQENKFIVVDELKFDEIKTKKCRNVLNNLKVNKALVVLNDNDET